MYFAGKLHLFLFDALSTLALTKCCVISRNCTWFSTHWEHSLSTSITTVFSSVYYSFSLNVFTTFLLTYFLRDLYSFLILCCCEYSSYDYRSTDMSVWHFSRVFSWLNLWNNIYQGLVLISLDRTLNQGPGNERMFQFYSQTSKMFFLTRHFSINIFAH